MVTRDPFEPRKYRIFKYTPQYLGDNIGWAGWHLQQWGIYAGLYKTILIEPTFEELMFAWKKHHEETRRP